MKVLIITGVHPTEFNPMSGIFVTRRIKKLQEFGIQVKVINYYKSEKQYIRVMKKFLRRPLNKAVRPLELEGVKYDFFPLELGIMDKIFYQNFHHKRIGKIGVKALKQFIDLSEFDIVHAHWVYPQGYMASLIKAETGMPCIITAHGSDIHTNPWKNPPTRLAIKNALNSADKVIFNSNNLFEGAKKTGYSGNNHLIIPECVDTDSFLPLDRELARKKLGLLGGKIKYIGYVGNISWVKRADKLAEIFNAVAQNYEQANFIVIGDGELKTQVENICSSHNLPVIFTGRIRPEEIALWMSALDVLILPSREEGFGNVVLEGQSCGCPVVGSNTGGIPEAIGEGGIVVDEGIDFEQRFGQAVVDMLKNPIPGEQLRKRAFKFDWNYITKKQVELYEEVLYPKKSP